MDERCSGIIPITYDEEYGVLNDFVHLAIAADKVCANVDIYKVLRLKSKLVSN